MKIVIVRHCDPDYEHDSLTAKGRKEAALLADRMKQYHPAGVYLSPLGRAQETARYTLEQTNWQHSTLPWLSEFKGECKKPNEAEIDCCWDWLPADWSKDLAMYDNFRWQESSYLKGTNVAEEYAKVSKGLDDLLAKHGYHRKGRLYEAVNPNNDTIILFCHYGVKVVMLSHLLGISPFPLWQGMVALPSSVTTVATEEREKGIAAFRMMGFGDISHLYAGGEAAAFAGRFCECYDNADELH